MTLTMKSLFKDEIGLLVKDIEKLVGYSPESFDLDLSETKSNQQKKNIIKSKALEIANKIAGVEIFFTLVSELNKDLNANVNEELKRRNNAEVLEGEPVRINLCEKVEDLTALFYSSRPRYWEYLTFKGKVIEQRIKILFSKWGYKYQLGLDIIDYFEELDRLLRISCESRIPFDIIVDSIKIRQDLNNLKVEDILEESIFSNNGIYSLSGDAHSNHNSRINVEESASEDRYRLYSAGIFKEIKANEDILIKGKNAIEEYIENDKKYTLVGKTSSNEYFITNENNIKIVRESFKNMEEFKPLKVEKRNKAIIKINLDELYDAAKELDLDLDEFKRFREKNLKEIDFIEVDSEKKVNQLKFDGFNNFAGMVNTGKTNFMVVASYALAKKGYKTCLVLRDNLDAFEQLENLNRNGKVKAAALVGSTSKVSHAEKILSSNTSKVKKSKFVDGEENILDMINDERLEYGTYTCPMKSLFDNKSDGTSSIYESTDPKDKLLCNRLFLRKKDGNSKDHTDIGVVCPFSRKCDSLKVNEYLPDADIYLTNMASFIKTEMNKLYFTESQRVSKYIHDVTDLTLMDEADAMQFQYDTSFSESMPIYNDVENPSVLEAVEEYKEKIRGNVDKFKEHNKLLFRISKTEMIASEILYKFIENKVPGYLKNGPIVSKKIYDTLSWLLSRNPELLKTNVDKINGLNVKYSSEEDETEEEKQSLIKLRTFFKDVSEIMYQASSQGLTVKEYVFAEKYEEEYRQYKDWFSYIEAVGYSDSTKIHLLNIYRDIKSKNIINPATLQYIESDTRAKNLILELISLAVLLTSMEGDLNKITNTTGYVKSMLYDISKKDVNNVPLSRGYVKDYIGLTSRCPLGLYFGLKYNKEKKSLEMISWEGIGRDLFYQYPELWKYKENNEYSGTNLAVFSGTSFMPTSPLYHILKEVDYLMKSNTGNPPKVKHDYKPIINDEGKVVVNSGSNKSKEEVANKIYQDIAKGLTKIIDDESILFKHIKTYTCEGRERLIISVGNYKDALRLASLLYQLNTDDNIKIAALYKEGIDSSLSFSLPVENRINKDTMKKIDSTDFNIVVVPQSAIQRGINMLKTQLDDNDDSGSKMVAAFGGIVKTNRDYQVPDNHEYAVARVSHILEKEKQRISKIDIDSSYSLSKEVNSLFKLATKTYNEYYSNKFFKDLELDERNMLMGDLLVEDVQFSGRAVRGNVDASIINLDGAFFRNYTEGLIDNEKTSTIVAMVKMCESIASKSRKNEFLMDSLYGPFLNGMKELVDKVTNNKLN